MDLTPSQRKTLEQHRALRQGTLKQYQLALSAVPRILMLAVVAGAAFMFGSAWLGIFIAGMATGFLLRQASLWWTASRAMPVLLEVNVGGEWSKSGLQPEDAGALLEQVRTLPHLEPRGLMCIPPFVEADEARPYFRQLRELGETLARDSGLGDDFGEYIILRRAGHSPARTAR